MEIDFWLKILSMEMKPKVFIIVTKLKLKITVYGCEMLVPQKTIPLKF